MISIPEFPSNVAAASIPPVVGIWSNSCISFVISTNGTCGNLSVGQTISVQVNVTNAPVGSINGYDIFLFYDPAVLFATTVDQTTGTVFTNILFKSSDLNQPGRVRANAASQGFNTSPNGVLFSISFSILKDGVSPISLAQGLIPGGQAQSYTVLTTPSNLAPTTADGYFTNVAGNPGPVSKFTISAKVTTGGLAIFDATGSYDPDAAAGAINSGIITYNWDFGGASALSGPTSDPVNTIRLGSAEGNYSVRLTVVDRDQGFQGMQTQLFTITKKPLHDLVAQSITPTPKIAHPGDKVAVTLIVVNNGTFFEDFKLAFAYSPPATIIGTKSNESINLGAALPKSFTWDTTGLSPGFYTLAANVTIIPSLNNPAGFENITSNNVASTQVQILGESSSVSPLLLIAGGTAAGVAALAVAGLLLRRRRRAIASP